MPGPWEEYAAKSQSGPWAEYAPKQPPKEGVVSDVVKSIPTGVAKGGAALVGLPGDLRDLGASGLDFISSKTGGDPQAGSNFKSAANKGFGALLGAVSMEPSLIGKEVPLPGSPEINETVSKPFGGYYEPKTTAGKYAETVASFAPNAISPGSVAAKAARVVVPGVASEAAGQATKGTGYEPLARAAGAVAGGIGVGAVEGALARNPIPTAQQLRAAADDAYGRADAAGLVISGDAFRQNAQRIAAEAAEQGIDPTLHPRATAALNRLVNMEGDPSLRNMDTLRRVVSSALESQSRDERRIAHVIRDGLDDFINNVDEGQVIAGNAEEGVAALREARPLWQRLAKSETIQRLVTRAHDRASQFSGSGYENALRTEFRKLAMNDRAMRRFTQEEQAAIRTVVQGGPVANALRMGGKLAPTGVISGGIGASGGAALGNAIGGPMGAVIGGFGVPALGAASRVGATAATTRNARLAEELMRAGPNAANPGATQLPRNVLLGALLSQASN